MSHKITGELVVETPKSIRPSESFIKRLIAFYKQQQQYKLEMSEIWQAITAHHLPLHTALLSENVSEVADLLANMYRSNLVFGLDDPWQSVSNVTGAYTDTWKRTLIDCATCMGVIPAYNPEQDNALEFDVDLVLMGMEKRINRLITYRAAGSVYGVSTDKHFVPIKLLRAAALIYTLEREERTLDVGLEIGAGLGYFGSLAGGIYHTIDLPIVSVLHAYLLAVQKGESDICLEGEPKHDAIRTYIHGIAMFDSLRMLDYAVNEDSLPEMPRGTGEALMTTIWERLRYTGVFLSVNHESTKANQVTVPSLVKDDLQLKHRSPCWYRPGYVEELYAPYD